jgi:hypothetical protein
MFVFCTLDKTQSLNPSTFQKNTASSENTFNITFHQQGSKDSSLQELFYRNEYSTNIHSNRKDDIQAKTPVTQRMNV